MQTVFFVSFLFLVLAASQQPTCTTCSAGCAQPHPQAACVGNAWVIPQDAQFSGEVPLACLTLVQGSATFAAGTKLSVVANCGQLNVGNAFNAPSGVGVTVDFQGAAVQAGTTAQFASFTTSTGYISAWGVSNMRPTGNIKPAPYLRNGQGRITLIDNAQTIDRADNGDVNTPITTPAAPGTPVAPVAPGTPAAPGTPNPPASDFDSTGKKIRKCPQLTCANTALCPQPTPDSTCAPSGEWVVPKALDVSSASLSCPIRIQGDFKVTSKLTIGGCTRIFVDGAVTLQNSDPNTYGVTVTFDLDDLGTPTAGEQIPWFSGTTITGAVGSWSAKNIWDSTGAITFDNLQCGNVMSFTFSPQGRPITCGAPRAEMDEAGFLDDGLMNAAVGDFSDLGEMNEFPEQAELDPADAAIIEDELNYVEDPADFAVGDESDNVFVDPADFAFEDESANFGDPADYAVGDETADFAFGDEYANFDETADFAFGDEYADFAVGDETANIFDDPADFAVGDETANIFDDPADFAVAADSNTNPATPTNAAPSYAYVLFVVGVMLLIALIVVQVQLVVIQRARAESRV